jgi:hypothetical protein
MFFLIHGHYANQRDLGFVADWCGHCGNLHVHRVTQHRRVAHLYFIPLGSGEIVASTMTCTACDGPHDWRPERYTGYIPEDSARSLTLGQILWKTNPSVADSVATRMRLESDAAAYQPSRGAGPDLRVALAFDKLADVHEEGAEQQRSLLECWETLDSHSREHLLREVDQLAEHDGRERNKARFITALASRYKPGDATWKFIVFVFAIIPGIVFSANYLKADGLELLGFALSLVAALTATLLFHRWYTRHVYRRFFRREFVPEAQRRGVPVAEVVETLGCINPRDKRVDEHLRALARGLPVLNEVLGEAGDQLQMANH